MTAIKQKRLSKVQNVLKSFFKNFQSNTIDYLYEEDIRAKLFFLFKEAFQEDLLIDNISRVKTEYHYSPNRKIDISILDDFRNVNPPIKTKEQVFELYKQKVEIGIEIKFQPVYSDQFGAFKKDIEKLTALVCSKEKMECIDTGIALLFFQFQSDFKDFKKNLFTEYSDVEFQLEENCINKIVISPENVLFSSSK